MDKVSPEPNSGCWLWTGSVWKQSNGDYGECWAFGKRELATHAAYREFKCERVPKGMILRHICDVPSCVNPDHLVLGTQTDNMADRQKRGRTARGERAGPSKLTADQVREIRASKMSGRKLGPIYGVSQVMIDKIKRREWWCHID
jgi:hypothetical protein